jgi:hypothetical protein
VKKLLASATHLHFVKNELKIALTFCRLAEQSDDAQFPRYVASARKAYDAALRYLFKLDMGSKEFDRITADAERVKFMLEALKDLRVNGGR